MKKICFVTTVGGTLRVFVLQLAEFLHKTGEFEISFISSPEQDLESILPDYIRFIPVHMERGINIGGIKAMLQMRKIFKKEKFDLVQYSTPNASCYASIASLLAKVPVRLYCQWGIAYVGFSGIKRQIFKLEEKLVCKLSTWIEPDSKSNLDFSHEECLYPKWKGSVVWNGSASGVDLTKFNIAKKDDYNNLIRKKYGIPKDAFVFGFVGRITADKGINELLGAAKKIIETNKDVWLILVGHPERTESVDKDLYDWAYECKQVLFSGYTLNAEQYIASMDCFILPSYREGFGMSVIEAESMGVPVIVTDIPGPIDAMIKDKTGFVVPPHDIDELKNNMEIMISNPEIRKTFSTNGINYVTTHFEQKKLFSKIYQDRKELLEKFGRKN